MKQIILVVLILGFVLVGCSSNGTTNVDPPSNEVKSNAILGKEQASIETTNKDTIGSEETLTELSNEQIVKLFEKANERFWYVQSGGKIEGLIETFDYEGMDYRFLGEDLNTLSKVQEYLGEVYSINVTQEIIDSMGLIEKDGKAAQPNADGGSLLNWSKAEVAEIASGNVKLNVPLGDTGEFEEKTVSLINEENKGWRVNGFLK